MAATYDVTQLADNPIYQVRYKIGDTDMDTVMLQDEEIQFAIDSKTDLHAAAVMCCETIVTRLAKNFNFKLGPSDNAMSEQYYHFSQILKMLRSQATPGPIFENPNRTIFSVDMMNATSCGYVKEE